MTVDASRSVGRDREADLEAASGVVVGDADGAAVRLDDASGDRQAEAAALAVGRGPGRARRGRPTTNSRGRSSSGMPPQASATVIRTSPSAVAVGAHGDGASLGVCRMALTSRLRITRPNSSGVDLDRQRRTASRPPAGRPSPGRPGRRRPAPPGPGRRGDPLQVQPQRAGSTGTARTGRSTIWASRSTSTRSWRW